MTVADFGHGQLVSPTIIQIRDHLEAQIAQPDRSSCHCDWENQNVYIFNIAFKG